MKTSTSQNLKMSQFIDILIYTINQVILAFWLVLAYDLLEDRHTIDVTTKFFSFCILKWRNVKLRITSEREN